MHGATIKTSTVLLAVCPQLQSVWTLSERTENAGCCLRSASCHQIVSSPSRQQLKRDPVTAVHHHVKHRTLRTKPPNTKFMLRQISCASGVEICPMKRCNFAGLCQRFGEACCPHLQG